MTHQLSTKGGGGGDNDLAGIPTVWGGVKSAAAVNPDEVEACCSYKFAVTLRSAFFMNCSRRAACRESQPDAAGLEELLNKNKSDSPPFFLFFLFINSLSSLCGSLIRHGKGVYGRHKSLTSTLLLPFLPPLHHQLTGGCIIVSVS